MGVAAGAAAGAPAGCSAVSSFLPQPATRRSPHAKGKLRILTQVFVFIFALSLENENLTQ
jgi:hypothetical protein